MGKLDIAGQFGAALHQTREYVHFHAQMVLGQEA